MQIIDGEIDIKDFKRSMVIKMPPPQPDFLKFRNQMEKFKKVFREMKTELNDAKKVLELSC